MLRLRSLLRRRELLSAAASVAVIGAGVIAFLPFGGDGPATAAVDGASASDARAGDRAPDFTVPLLDGGEFELAAHRGSPVWINYWATWCPTCRAEMPDVDEARKLGEAAGLVFLAMNLGETPADIRSYLEHTGYDFAVGIDARAEFARLYRMMAIPAHVFIAADGTVDVIRVGEMTRGAMVKKVGELTAASAGRSTPRGETGTAP